MGICCTYASRGCVHGSCPETPCACGRIARTRCCSGGWDRPGAGSEGRAAGERAAQPLPSAWPIRDFSPQDPLGKAPLFGAFRQHPWRTVHQKSRPGDVAFRGNYVGPARDRTSFQRSVTCVLFGCRRCFGVGQTDPTSPSFAACYLFLAWKPKPPIQSSPPENRFSPSRPLQQ